jgi:hypothetical protein
MQMLKLSDELRELCGYWYASPESVMYAVYQGRAFDAVKLHSEVEDTLRVCAPAGYSLRALRRLRCIATALSMQEAFSL